MMRDDDPLMHPHIGVDTDANGDGYVCMRVVGPVCGPLHLHVDNNLPLP